MGELSLQAREQTETGPERAVLDARVLLIGPAADRERDVAAQRRRRLLPLRARRALVLDGLLYVAVEPQVHDLQGQQLVAGECIPITEECGL